VCYFGEKEKNIQEKNYGSNSISVGMAWLFVDFSGSVLTQDIFQILSQLFLEIKCQQ